jgi:hypothetical protein
MAARRVGQEPLSLPDAEAPGVLGGLTFASSAFKIFNRKGRKDEKAADARP